MDSRKRRLVDHHRLGDLPDCLLHDILSRLGSRQAVQTSALSRRWRHLWRDVPCVDIDQREFENDPWWSFEDFVDRLSSLPPAAPQQLDAFRLHLVNSDGNATSDRSIRRCLRRSPAAVHIHAHIGTSHTHDATVCWPPPWLRLDSCTRRLTRLRLFGVRLADGFVEHLGELCPVLEDLHIEKCKMYQLRAVTSPTLKTLAIIGPRAYAGGADLVLTAPRLASLRLNLTYDGQYGDDAGAPDREKEVLSSLAQASICITDTGHYYLPNQRARKKGKLAFLRAMCSLLARLPNVTNLDLSGFTTTALLDEESQEFPLLHNLRTLLLDGCDFGVSLQALTSILRNTPNLEKLRLHSARSPDPNEEGKEGRGVQGEDIIFPTT